MLRMNLAVLGDGVCDADSRGVDLRCYDDDLTEEINRRITDSLSDYLFTPSKKESDNLKKENIQGKIYLVGNIMIDSLEFFFKKKRSSKTLSNHFDGLMTFHRPENVDNKIKLGKLIKEIKKWTKKYKIIFKQAINWPKMC